MPCHCQMSNCNEVHGEQDLTIHSAESRVPSCKQKTECYNDCAAASLIGEQVLEESVQTVELSVMAIHYGK